MLSYEACVVKDLCDARADLRVGVAGIKDKVVETAEKPEDFATVGDMMKVVRLAKIEQQLKEGNTEVGVGSIVEKITETAEKNRQQDPVDKVGQAAIAGSIETTALQSSNPEVGQKVGLAKIKDDLIRTAEGAQDKEEAGDIIKIGVHGIKDAILETIKVEQKEDRAGKVIKSIGDVINDDGVIKIGVHGIKDAILETIKVREDERTNSRSFQKVGTDKLVAEIGGKIVNKSIAENVANVGAASVADNISKNIAKNDKGTSSSVGAARVVDEIAQNLGKNSDHSVSYSSDKSGVPNFGVAGVAQSIEKQLVDRQFERAQRVIKQMLHSVKGRPFNKPKKEKEIEQFGDKIRVRVNRIKDRVDLNRHSQEINEV